MLGVFFVWVFGGRGRRSNQKLFPTGREKVLTILKLELDKLMTKVPGRFTNKSWLSKI